MAKIWGFNTKYCQEYQIFIRQASHLKRPLESAGDRLFFNLREIGAKKQRNSALHLFVISNSCPQFRHVLDCSSKTLQEKEKKMMTNGPFTASLCH